MGFTQSQYYLVTTQAWERGILRAWSSLGDMLTLGETGYVNELRKFLGETSSTKYTITTTLLGERSILIEIFGSCERAQLLAFQVKKALLEDLWEKYQSSFKAYMISTKTPENNWHYLSAQQSTVQDVVWEELKPRAKEIKEEIPLKKGWFLKKPCPNGSPVQALSSEEEMLTNLRTAISGLKTSLDSIPQPPKCCMFSRQ